MTDDPVYLTDQDLGGLGDFAAAVDVLDGAFRDLAAGAAATRPRQRIASTGSTFNAMIGSTSDGFFGLKAYTVSTYGAPMHVLLYASDGTGLKAVLSGGAMSLLRTGAASGLSARYQAPSGTDVIGIIGAGGQAKAQVQGVLAGTGATRVKVLTRHLDRARAFADGISEATGVRAEAVSSVAEVFADSGVIVTMTNSAEPAIRSDEVPNGVHLIAAGNNNPARAEIDPLLIVRADRVVVDDVDQALLECGELIRAAESGFDPTTLVSLADVVSGAAEGRRNDNELTIFESQGVGLEDAAIGAHLYRAARAAGKGTVLP